MLREMELFNRLVGFSRTTTDGGESSSIFVFVFKLCGRRGSFANKIK